MNIKIQVSPGSMGVAKQAVDLFGVERVDGGTWLTPVYVHNLSEDEFNFAKEFFGELGCTVEKAADI